MLFSLWLFWLKNLHFSTNSCKGFIVSLIWLHFDNEPRVQEKQQVKDQQSCISIFEAYPTIPGSN